MGLDLTVEGLARGRRYCFYIMPGSGETVLVVEGEYGYYPVVEEDFRGMDEEGVAAANAALGLSEQEAFLMVVHSMRPDPQNN
jgi:hypothetical protein